MADGENNKIWEDPTVDPAREPTLESLRERAGLPAEEATEPAPLRNAPSRAQAVAKREWLRERSGEHTVSSDATYDILTNHRQNLILEAEAKKELARMEEEEAQLRRELGLKESGIPLTCNEEGELVPGFSPEQIREMNLFLALRPGLVSDEVLRAGFIHKIEEAANESPIDNSGGKKILRAWWEQYLDEHPERKFLLEQPTRIIANAMGYDMVPVDVVNGVVRGAEPGILQSLFGSKTRRIRKAQQVALEVEQMNQEAARLKEKIAKDAAEIKVKLATAEEKKQTLVAEGMQEKARLVAEGERVKGEKKNEALVAANAVHEKLLTEQKEAILAVERTRQEAIAATEHELSELRARIAEAERDAVRLEQVRRELMQKIDELVAVVIRTEKNKPLAADLLKQLEATERDREARDLREVVSDDMSSLKLNGHGGYKFEDFSEWAGPVSRIYEHLGRLAALQPRANTLVFLRNVLDSLVEEDRVPTTQEFVASGIFEHYNKAYLAIMGKDGDGGFSTHGGRQAKSPIGPIINHALTLDPSQNLTDYFTKAAHEFSALGDLWRTHEEEEKARMDAEQTRINAEKEAAKARGERSPEGGRDPQIFVPEVLEYLNETEGNMTPPYAWAWSVSEDGRFINMTTVIGALDVPLLSKYLDEERDGAPPARYDKVEGQGVESLVEYLKGKRVRSLNISGRWYLEVIDPGAGGSEVELKEQIEGRDPETFIPEVVDALSAKGELPRQFNLIRTKVGRDFINLNVHSDLIPEGFADRVVNFSQYRMGPDDYESTYPLERDSLAPEGLLKYLKGKRLISVLTDGNWYLEVVEPKEKVEEIGGFKVGQRLRVRESARTRGVDEKVLAAKEIRVIRLDPGNVQGTGGGWVRYQLDDGKAIGYTVMGMQQVFEIIDENGEPLEFTDIYGARLIATGEKQKGEFRTHDKLVMPEGVGNLRYDHAHIIKTPAEIVGFTEKDQPIVRDADGSVFLGTWLMMLNFEIVRPEKNEAIPQPDAEGYYKGAELAHTLKKVIKETWQGVDLREKNLAVVHDKTTPPRVSISLKKDDVEKAGLTVSGPMTPFGLVDKARAMFTYDISLNEALERVGNSARAKITTTDIGSLVIEFAPARLEPKVFKYASAVGGGGNEILSTGEQSKFGYRVGQKLRLKMPEVAYGNSALLKEEYEYEVAGFAAFRDGIIVQINDGEVISITPKGLPEYFDVVGEPGGEEKNEAVPQPDAEGRYEAEPLIDYLVKRFPELANSEWRDSRFEITPNVKVHSEKVLSCGLSMFEIEPRAGSIHESKTLTTESLRSALKKQGVNLRKREDGSFSLVRAFK